MISCLPTIAKAVQQIRDGELTSAELVEFCLARINCHELSIQAWEFVDSDGARQEAVRLDQQAREGQLAGPLHGIPIGVKDIIDVAGWPTKAGSPTRSDHVATADATLVARLRYAGAIILGKTVTTEFACFDPARTYNPWNLERTPGGSSSGSAAAVAAQMCMAAIGTQTGGSIIRPASYCGVCGLKPTLGYVPLDGVVPISSHLDHAGPIARTVRDAARVFFSLVDSTRLRSMWDFDEGTEFLTSDESSVTVGSLDWLLFERPEQQPARTIRLRPVVGFFEDMAAAGVWKCFQAALKQLGNSHQFLPPLPLPASFHRLHERHRRIMAVDAAAYHRDVFERRPADFGPNISSLIESGLTELAVDYVADVEWRTEFRNAFCQWLGPDTLAITPSTTTTAPTRETTGNPAFNSPWSYAGLPSITVPCGLDGEGLPCGLQIIGPPASELNVLRSAWRCERALDFQHHAV